jgi:hypothetical protein
VEIDKRFVEYLLELSDGVTGRIIEILRRAAFQGLADKSQKVWDFSNSNMWDPVCRQSSARVVIFPFGDP